MNKSLIIVIGIVVVSVSFFASFLGENKNTGSDFAELPEKIKTKEVEWVEWKEDKLITKIYKPSFLKEIYVSNKAYLIGKFLTGKYLDWNIYFAPVAYGEMGGSPYGYIALNTKDGNFVYLDNVFGKGVAELYLPEESNLGYIFNTKLKRDSDVRLSDLLAEKPIITDEINKVDYELTPGRVWSTSGTMFMNAEKNNLEPFFVDQVVGQVYKEKKFKTGATFARRSDGILLTYAPVIPFLYKEKADSYELIGTGKLLTTDNSLKNKIYSYVDIGGCGVKNYLAISNEKVNLNELEKISSTSDDREIYRLKNLKNEIYNYLYQSSYKDPAKPELQSLDLFAKNVYKTNALLFVYDNYGNLIKLTSNEFVPAAECGKPVIYLYPKKEIKINVQVSPLGGFTKTEPTYPKNGWNVVAKPNGEITSLDDNKKYPYLFWEGRGGLYEMPSKGWSVAQKDVEFFLKSKLSELGLVENEIRDFIEFWIPRMQTHKYYFITFMGNQTMDNLAPLNINPKPDTVIRVLMDFKGIDALIKSDPIKIITPERNGFTVIEWGGVINQ